MIYLKRLILLPFILFSLVISDAYSQSSAPTAREMMEEFSRMFEEQNRRMNDLILEFFEKSDYSGHFDDFDESLSSQQLRPRGLQFRSSFGGLSEAEIRRADDERHIIFELDGKGIDPNALKIDVSGGMVTVSGQIKNEHRSDEQGQFFQSTSISSFSRSFPVPGDAEADSIRIKKQDDKIQIKFDRRRV